MKTLTLRLGQPVICTCEIGQRLPGTICALIWCSPDDSPPTVRVRDADGYVSEWPADALEDAQ